MIKEEKLPRLSERMLIAAEMISKGSRVADIGCDHGYVSIYLYKSGRAKSCIAADVNKGPLEAAMKNTVCFDACDGVETRLSDGLSKIKAGEADSILITGMGGSLIVKILSQGAEVLNSVNELVLEPQSDSYKVREFLADSFFAIEKEDFVKERGKYYPVIKAVKTIQKQKLSELQLMYGPFLLAAKNGLLKEFILKRKKILEKVRLNLEDKTASEAESAKRIEKELSLIYSAEEYYK